MSGFLNKKNNIDEPHVKKDPKLNLINQEELHERTGKVFAVMGEALAKSFGPGGAPTIISQYPYHHITKDGFTIQKSLEFDKSESYLDQIIADMAKNICARLNFSVGDGTTTAMIATYSTYQSYLEMEEMIELNHYLPRDIMKAFNKVKDKLIDSIRERAIKINVSNKDEMAKHIRDVVYISSNGDDELTDIITNLYLQLGYPAINVSLSQDGITRSSIVEGFQNEAVILDQLYVNTDNQTMDDKNVDILIYDHKITLDTYKYTLKPLAMMCKLRGRHLVVLAPMYDEKTLQTVIAGELRKEYQQTKDISLVLMAYKNHLASQKKMISDLCMLCRTELINTEMDRLLNEKMNDFLSMQIPPIDAFPINIDDRGIMNITVQTSDKEIVQFTEENRDSVSLLFKNGEDKLDLGFCGNVSLGMKSSIFKEFKYDEDLYNIHLAEAERELNEAELKYQKLGTFNVEISNCQQRLNGLKLKLGTIEVGSDSEFSKTYMKDMVDDAVKAAKSAFNNGIILGCNVTLIQETCKMLNEMPEDFGSLEYSLLDMIYKAFRKVYKIVLNNAYKSMPVDNKNVIESLKDYMKVDGVELIENEEYANNLLKSYDYKDLKEFIIDYSLCTGTVYDISTGTFTDSVVNSAETDIQVLRAVSDLMSLLITGNQLVISQFDQFNS